MKKIMSGCLAVAVILCLCSCTNIENVANVDMFKSNGSDGKNWIAVYVKFTRPTVVEGYWYVEGSKETSQDGIDTYILDEKGGYDNVGYKQVVSLDLDVIKEKTENFSLPVHLFMGERDVLTGKSYSVEAVISMRHDVAAKEIKEHPGAIFLEARLTTPFKGWKTIVKKLDPIR